MESPKENLLKSKRQSSFKNIQQINYFYFRHKINLQKLYYNFLYLKKRVQKVKMFLIIN
jgi:hypothetical protein